MSRPSLALAGRAADYEEVAKPKAASASAPRPQNVQLFLWARRRALTCALCPSKSSASGAHRNERTGGNGIYWASPSRCSRAGTADWMQRSTGVLRTREAASRAETSRRFVWDYIKRKGKTATRSGTRRQHQTNSCRRADCGVRPLQSSKRRSTRKNWHRVTPAGGGRPAVQSSVAWRRGARALRRSLSIRRRPTILCRCRFGH